MDGVRFFFMNCRDVEQGIAPCQLSACSSLPCEVADTTQEEAMLPHLGPTTSDLWGLFLRSRCVLRD